jgi:predicted phage tail protein
MTSRRSTPGAPFQDAPRQRREVGEAIRMRARDWTTIQASCSAVRRGLSVWQTAPMPMIAYQASTWAWVFQARVATRSPVFTPSPQHGRDLAGADPSGRHR